MTQELNMNLPLKPSHLGITFIVNVAGHYCTSTEFDRLYSWDGQIQSLKAESKPGFLSYRAEMTFTKGSGSPGEVLSTCGIENPAGLRGLDLPIPG